MGGAVKGSVNMIVEKKTIGQDKSKVSAILTIGLFDKKAEAKIVVMLNVKNENSKENLRILRTIKSPKIMVIGISGGFATHQLALLPKNPKIKTAMAAGLKICFLFIIRIYFEAIAKIAPNIRGKISEKELAGDKIRNKIKAVMANDSQFVEALNILASNLLVKKQTAINSTAEISKLMPE